MVTKTLFAFVIFYFRSYYCCSQSITIEYEKTLTSFYNSLDGLTNKPNIWEYPNSPFSAPIQDNKCNNLLNYSISIGYYPKTISKIQVYTSYQKYNYYDKSSINRLNNTYLLKSFDLYRIQAGIKYFPTVTCKRLMPFFNVSFGRMIRSNKSNKTLYQGILVNNVHNPDPNAYMEVEIKQGANFFFIPRGFFLMGIGFKEKAIIRKTYNLSLTAEINRTITPTMNIELKRQQNQDIVIYNKRLYQQNLYLGIELAVILSGDL